MESGAKRNRTMDSEVSAKRHKGRLMELGHIDDKSGQREAT